MDHGGEAARPTALGSTNLAMDGAVQGGEANFGTGTFDGQHAAAAARRASFDVFNLSEAYAGRNSTEFARQVRAAAGRGEVPVAVFRRQPGSDPADVVLVGVQLPLPDVVPAHDNYGYSPLLPRPGAGRFVVLADLLPGGVGAAYNGDYAPQPRPGAGRGEVVLVDLDLLPGGGGAAYNGDYALQPRPGAGRGEVVPVDLDLLSGGAGSAYNGYYTPQPRPGAGRGEVVLVDLDLLPGGAGAAYNGDYVLQPRPGVGRGEVVLVDLDLHPGGAHADAAYNGEYALQPHPGAGLGEVVLVDVDLIPGGSGASYNGDYALQPRPGVGRGEVVLVDLDLLPDGVDAAYNGYYVWQPRPGGEVFIGPLPDGGVGAVFDNSGNFAQQSTLQGAGRADGIAGALRGHSLGLGGAVYDNPSVVGEHLRRLLPFAGICACSVAVNGIAAGPGAPAAAFHLFALLLVGLFMVTMHVLRV